MSDNRNDKELGERIDLLDKLARLEGVEAREMLELWDDVLLLLLTSGVGVEDLGVEGCVGSKE